MASDPFNYGLPGVAALDSPYGLRSSGQEVEMPAMLPVMRFAPLPRQPMGLRGGLGGGSAMLPGPVRVAPTAPNVVPFRATDPSFKPGAAPTVGRDITLEQLTEIQRKKESSNNYQALNTEKVGNTASGAYQYTDGTWNNYGGYAKAMLAPKAVQDRRYQEDILNRVNKYNGDMFKAIADHYLPAFAGDPSKWREPQRVKVGKNKYVTVGSVENYLRHVLGGSPYEKQLDAYLNGQ